MTGFLDHVAAAGPGLAMRSTVLFLAACGLAIAMKRASAAERHLVWSAASAAALALPVNHPAAPAWHVLPLVGPERVGAGPAAAGPISNTAAGGPPPACGRAALPGGASRAVAQRPDPGQESSRYGPAGPQCARRGRGGSTVGLGERGLYLGITSPWRMYLRTVLRSNLVRSAIADTGNPACEARDDHQPPSN